MGNLEKKIAEIENKQLQVKKKIAALEKRLEKLTGKSLFSEEQVEAHNFTEEKLKNRTSGVTTVASMSKLPSFMRPTICSRVKSETIHQFSECRVPVPRRRRRRRTSHRAESVSLHVKDYSDFNSENSIPRSSCLVTLNERRNADNATEYSQDTSESDVKLHDLPEQKKHASDHIQENSERQMDRTNYNKNSMVDKWFDLQKNGTSTSGYNHMTKRIVAIPKPKKKQMQKENGKAQKKIDEKKYSFYDLKLREVASNNKKDKSVLAVGLGRSPSEVETDKLQTTPNDFFNRDVGCNSILASETTEGKRTTQKQEYVGDSSLEKNRWKIPSTKDNDCNELRGIYITQADKGKIQSSDNFQSNNNLDGSITRSKGDSDSYISISEELCYQQVVKNSEGQEADFSIQAPIINKLQAQKNNTGICHFLKQKLEVLLASALLGLGFCSLGYEHEFFYSLEL